MITPDYSALTGELQQIFNDAAKNKVAKAVGMTIFGVKSTDLLDYKYQILHGVDGVVLVSEGQDYPTTSGKQGDSITFTQLQYGRTITVTKKIRKFWRTANGDVAKQVKTTTETTFDRIDQSMADRLLYGFSTSYTDVFDSSVSAVCPDGLALFSDAHTNNANTTTFSNIIVEGATTNPVLSRAAIVETIATGRKFKRPINEGKNIGSPVELDTLLVGPELYDAAVRFIESAKISGSANNDTNSSIGHIKIKMWSRLAATGQGTDRAAYWYMYDSSMVGETLIALFSQKPQFYAPEEQNRSKNWDYTIDAFYALGNGWPAYIYASNGTLS